MKLSFATLAKVFGWKSILIYVRKSFEQNILILADS